MWDFESILLRGPCVEDPSSSILIAKDLLKQSIGQHASPFATGNTTMWLEDLYKNE